MRPRLLYLALLCIGLTGVSACSSNLLNRLESPVLLQGNDSTAYRDPAVIYHRGTFYLYFTVSRITPDSIVNFVAQSESRDLLHWSAPRPVTPIAQHLGYSSPGNVVRYGDEWILCLQTYPRPDYRPEQGVRYGNDQARLFIMRSRDLQHWSEPELLPVKGDIPVEEMGRMIDPYLIEDRDEPGKWWCFYKQQGASMPYTYDFRRWTYFGRTNAGENVSLLTTDSGYIMFHSPENGIAMKRSADMREWQDFGSLITLGQDKWDWARGRLTAGTVLDLRHVRRIGHYLMFFHGSGPLTESEGDFNRNASIGIAWSDDLVHWEYPGGNSP